MTGQHRHPLSHAVAIVQYDGESVIQASRQVSRRWLCLKERQSKSGEGWATQPGANKVWEGGKCVTHVHVCLLGLAGRDRLSGWQACHGPVSALTDHCGSVGLMRSSNRMTKGCRETGTGRGAYEERKTRRKRTQVPAPSKSSSH